MTRASLLLATLALLLGSVAQADSLRCDSALVSTNDNMSQVLRKCGEPAARASAGFVRHVESPGRQVSVPVEQWTYGPTYGMYHYLRFEGQRLVSIDSERG